MKKDGDDVVLRNERGFEYIADASIVEEGMDNANQFSETRKITRVQMVKILETTHGAIFTVNFNKQVTKDAGEVKLQDISADDLATKAGRLKVMDNLLKGEERTIRGKVVKVEPKLGRTQVIDQDVNDDHKERLVDHRTINWLIFQNIKYVAP